MIGYIYKITNPKGKIYIGQTKNIKIRFNSYKFKHNNNQTKIYNSLKKYGIEKHSFEVIFECPMEMLDYIESVYIKYYDAVKTGLNCRPGGNSSKWTDEMKEKLSKCITGRKVKFSEQAIENIREGVKNRKHKTTGTPHTEESKKKMSESRKGRVITKEWREKLSLSGKLAYSEGKRISPKGRKLSEDTKYRIGQGSLLAHQRGSHDSKKRAVLCYDMNGIFLQEYESVTEAARQLSINQSTLQMALMKKGIVKSKSYKWQYKDETIRYANTKNQYSPR